MDRDVYLETVTALPMSEYFRVRQASECMLGDTVPRLSCFVSLASREKLITLSRFIMIKESVTQTQTVSVFRLFSIIFTR